MGVNMNEHKSTYAELIARADECHRKAQELNDPDLYVFYYHAEQSLRARAKEIKIKDEIK
jgi:hypothetical protein